jgi:hypothetical protein
VKKLRRKLKTFEPTPFMQEAHSFMTREPVGSSLPAPCLQLLLDALDMFEEEPELRDRGQGAASRVGGEWRFSLLGLVASTTGFDAVERHDTPLVALREHLTKLGFTYFDQLCLHEINQHSIGVDVLRERVVRFAETGERMPFLDDLHSLDTGREDPCS